MPSPAAALLTLCAPASSLAGHVQLMPFSVAEYNRLPHFWDLPAEGPDDLLSIQPGSKVLREHGLGGVAGLFLNHRHFDLRQGEALVSRPEGASLVAEPTTNGTAGALPYYYRFSETPSGSIEMRPMEFLDQPGGSFQAHHDAVVSNAAFLSDYAATLRDAGLLSKFGLFLYHREGVVGNSSLETTSGDERALRVRSAEMASQEDGGEDMEVRAVVFGVPDAAAPEVPGILKALCGHGHSSCSHSK